MFTLWLPFIQSDVWSHYPVRNFSDVIDALDNHSDNYDWTGLANYRPQIWAYLAYYG